MLVKKYKYLRFLTNCLIVTNDDDPIRLIRYRFTLRRQVIADEVAIELSLIVIFSHINNVIYFDIYFELVTP